MPPAVLTIGHSKHPLDRFLALLAGRRANHNRGKGQWRIMKASFIFFAVLLVIGGIAVAGHGDAPQHQPTRFKITTKRKDDSVEVKAEKDRTVYGVKSPFGISQAVIERQQDPLAGRRGTAAAFEGPGGPPGLQRQGRGGCGRGDTAGQS